MNGENKISSTKNNLAQCPEWLLELIMKKSTTTKKKNNDKRIISTGIPEGQRNDTLFRYACQKRDQGLSKGETTELVEICAQECQPPLPEEEILNVVESAWSYSKNDEKNLSNALTAAIMPFSEFRNLDLPRPKMLMKPWLEECSITLISAQTGLGKTMLAMEISSAIANGRPAMNGIWEVEKSAPVLYVDGEMHWSDIWERGDFFDLEKVYVLSKTYLEHNDITPSLNLADEKHRNFLFKQIEKLGCKLVILDNIYSLIIGLDDDKGKDWGLINQWLLCLRSKGISVILIHHTGKSGDQLGTSSREFNVNTSLVLKPFKAHSNDENVAFTIDVKKQRKRGLGLSGKIFQCNDGRWTITEIKKKKDNKQQMTRMLVEGMPYKDIEKKMGLSSSRISQIKGKLIKDGFIKEKKGKGVSLTTTGKKWLKNTSMSN